MSALKKLIDDMEIDTRLLGMVGALIVIWIGFDLFTNGRFITPRNLYNLSVQTASVAVMATGMVLVIVTRHIDLSVGSVLGVVAMMMGVLQVDILPPLLGFDHPMTWVLTLTVGILIGAAIGGVQGAVIGFLGVPAFIVTLGGLLVWRGAAWWVTQGRTVAPLDSSFQLMGGGVHGTIGETWSWIVAALVIAAIIATTYLSRRRRKAFDFPLKPVWAEITIAGVFCALVFGFVATLNAYYLPKRAAERYAEANNIPVPEGGLQIAHGIPISVLIVAAVAVVMTVLATRTRFGRHIFAIGGNPEAASLSGINVKMMTVVTFVIVGVLCAISAAIASARLQSAANDLGTLDELRVIAAAVIGGCSLAGGVGTIYGALLGALVMQSLQSGMALIGINTSLQSIIIGIVLVLAVWVDHLYRSRRGGD